MTPAASHERTPAVSPHDPRRAQRAPEPLATFNAAGVLGPGEVHAATTLGRLAGEADPGVLLAAALAVRAPRVGHVCVDLPAVRHTVTSETDHPVDIGALPWPDDARWRQAVAASPLARRAEHEPAPAAARAGHTSDGHEPSDTAPLVLSGTRLYLDRYWRYERRVVADLTARAAAPPGDVDPDALRDAVDRLFPAVDPGRGSPAHPPEPVDHQRLAAASAVLRRLAVIAGGPGTGKTTTVTKAVALLLEQAVASERRWPRIALAAPTGKAAARLEEAVREAAAELPTDPAVAAQLGELTGSTIHRLLGVRPGRRTRFRHDRTAPLPYDVVVVDESSMVSLALLAKLLDAVRPEARVVLVGDPQQLASVEAGAVLGDLVGPATAQPAMRPAAREELAAVAGGPVAAGLTGGAQRRGRGPETARGGVAVGDGIVVLRRIHRFGGGIAELADAIQSGDADRAVAALDSAADDVDWLAVEEPDRPEASGAPDAHQAASAAVSPQAASAAVSPQAAFAAFSSHAALAAVRSQATAAGAAVIEAARRGDAQEALAALARFRLLCAHRRGPFGVAHWARRVESWLAEDVDGFDSAEFFSVGRPVLVTENDYQLGLSNGDTGVVVADSAGRRTVAFADGGGVRHVAPSRLESVETLHAMTIHKSQGSQFPRVVVVLPPSSSPLLTRELLYTAVTRAQHHLTVLAAADTVRAAVGRPIQRASGLWEALWHTRSSMSATRTPAAGSPPTTEEAVAALRADGLTPRSWSNAPGDRYGSHEHRYHKRLICTEGSITFHTPDGDHELGPGDQLDVEPGTSHAATVGPDGVTCVEAAL